MDPNRQIDLHSPNPSSSILRRRGLMVTSNRASEFGLTVSSGHMYLHWQESCQVQYDSADRYIYLESALDAEMNSGTSGCSNPGSLWVCSVHHDQETSDHEMWVGNLRHFGHFKGLLQVWLAGVVRPEWHLRRETQWNDGGLQVIHFTHIRKSVSSLFLRAFLVPRVLGPVASPLMINFMMFPTSTVYVSAHLQTSLNGASEAKILGSAKLLKIPTCRTQPE